VRPTGSQLRRSDTLGPFRDHTSAGWRTPKRSLTGSLRGRSGISRVAPASPAVPLPCRNDGHWIPPRPNANRHNRRTSRCGVAGRSWDLGSAGHTSRQPRDDRQDRRDGLTRSRAHDLHRAAFGRQNVAPSSTRRHSRWPRGSAADGQITDPASGERAVRLLAWQKPSTAGPAD